MPNLQKTQVSLLSFCPALNCHLKFLHYFVCRSSHGTADVGYFYKTYRGSCSMMHILQKYSKCTLFVHMNTFHTCSGTIWTPRVTWYIHCSHWGISKNTAECGLICLHKRRLYVSTPGDTMYYIYDLPEGSILTFTCRVWDKLWKGSHLEYNTNTILYFPTFNKSFKVLAQYRSSHIADITEIVANHIPTQDRKLKCTHTDWPSEV